MIWSFSAVKTFGKCQRQWYFKNCLAHARAKDSRRHEAYLLKQLQSLKSWRGQLVDKVISKYVVPALNRHQSIHEHSVLGKARSLYDLQLDYALAHQLREPGMSKSKVDDAFAAFHAVEYGDAISEQEISLAWDEIERSIKAFFGMEDLWMAMRSASYRVAQPPLQFDHSGVKVKAFPDLIMFYDDDPPLVVDWKVQTQGIDSYRLQLALYALALIRCKPHKGFPDSLRRWTPADVRLLEVQLLTDRNRYYNLTETDFDELERHIAASAHEMLMVRGDAPASELCAEDFSASRSPWTCQYCPFRKLCWETSYVED